MSSRPVSGRATGDDPDTSCSDESEIGKEALDSFIEGDIMSSEFVLLEVILEV